MEETRREFALNATQPNRFKLASIMLAIVAAFMLVWIGSPSLAYQLDRIVANAPLPTQTYIVGTPPKTRRLVLEVASTGEQQRRGLMARDKVAKDGMAFPYPGQPASFWMRGTRIALDIVYVGIDGRVESIVMGKPFDESPLPSKGPVSLVIEVPAGKAKAYGLKIGAPVKAVR